MDLSLYKQKLPEYLVTYHGINPKKLFNCLNPEHEDRHPSMGYSQRYNICKCFSCGAIYDIFDLVKIDYGYNDFKDQLSKVLELYDSDKLNLYENNFTEKEPVEIIDFTRYFERCKKDICKTNYLQNRGIDEKLLLKYNIGYDSEKKRIIFPLNKNSYVARGTEDNLKLKSKGISYLWNENLLENSDKETLIYVTEGIIDSLSLETLNPRIKTISLNGLPNTKRLVQLIKEANYKGTLVLVFDKDYAGLTAQENLKKELDDINICSYSLTLINGFDNDCKDINEALLKDKSKLNNTLVYIHSNLENIIREKNKSKEEELEY